LKPILQTANLPAASWGTLADDRGIVFNIRGVIFTNNLNSSTMTKLPTGIFGAMFTKINNVTFNTGGNILTFKKFQEIVDLNIFYNRISKNTNGNYQINTTTPFPDFMFSFMIYGVKKRENTIKEIISSNNMFNAECATLVLRTADLPANSSNAVGSTNQYITNMTWNNINLRTLLGSMYEKYDRFALVPTQIQSITAFSGVGTTGDDRNIMIFISGLPFINNTYNVSTLTNQNSAFINFIKFLTSNTASASTTPNILLFSKNQELVNLNIYYQRINKNGNTPPTYDPVTTAAFPQMLFAFNIYGIEKTDRIPDSNGSRIF
jgi:hypothetical protein